jgi:DNA topoisomerase VI subunit A
LFEAVQLAERYNLAIVSTKGMSVVAARNLLDKFAKLVDHVFVLHDFDVSGFSIMGALGTDSRRYTFESDLYEVIVDLGLRLTDIEEMGLQAETVEVKSREARRETLERHGATDEEIEFLAPEDETRTVSGSS